MGSETLKGRVFKYGDMVDTDVIIPARYCTNYHAEDLAPHCLEDLDDTFAKRVNEGDILVAGENFGCGSSRENAPIAIRGVGVSCVIAKSFARIFFRNSINIGLPILIAPSAVDGIEDGDEVEVNPASGMITNHTRGGSWQAAPFPPEVQEIIDVGGLVEYVKGRLGG
ncbi:MAG: 3-isopropylmalate dehydratase small subunit [Calditrichaeota bacterium]|nr:3-isopropylmalate dehydratase small subunit [Calditrichota bacterium]